MASLEWFRSGISRVQLAAASYSLRDAALAGKRTICACAFAFRVGQFIK